MEESRWLSRCARPLLGTTARGLLSLGPGVPGARTKEKEAHSAFRNLPGKRPAPKSSSSGSRSGGGGAPGTPSSMAHREGSKRGRLPTVPRLRSETRAHPTSCSVPRPLVPKPGSAARPAGRGGGAGARGYGLRGTAPPGPAASRRRREGRRGGTEGRRERAGGGGGPGPEGIWRPCSAPCRGKVSLSSWGSRRAGWGWGPRDHPSNPSAFWKPAPNPDLHP